MLKNKVHPALNQKVNNNPFYQNIIGKVDSLINLFRDEFKLIVNKDNQGRTIDPLNTHEFGSHLVTIRCSATSGLNEKKKPRFNFESLLKLVNAANQGKFSTVIKMLISELYYIITTDIQTSEAKMGGRFFYQEINCDVAAEIIQTLSKNDANNPAGEMIWRICLGLNSEQANEFMKKYGALITQIRQLSSYKEYQLFSNHYSIPLTFILDNPWLLTFFTTEQLISFITSRALIKLKIIKYYKMRCH